MDILKEMKAAEAEARELSKHQRMKYVQRAVRRIERRLERIEALLIENIERTQIVGQTHPFEVEPARQTQPLMPVRFGEPIVRKVH